MAKTSARVRPRTAYPFRHSEGSVNNGSAGNVTASSRRCRSGHTDGEIQNITLAGELVPK